MRWLIVLSVLILSSCSDIPHDKKLHFGVGAIVATATYIETEDPNISCASAVLAGAIKEIVDLAGSGTPEFLDFAYTAAGCIFPYVIHYLRSGSRDSTPATPPM